MGGVPAKIRGTVLGVPISTDYSILESILGYPYLGKLPYGGYVGLVLREKVLVPKTGRVFRSLSPMESAKEIRKIMKP